MSCGGSGGSTGLSGDTPCGAGPEDLTYARPVELEVLDQAWDGPVGQVAAACQVVEVHPWDPSRWASA